MNPVTRRAVGVLYLLQALGYAVTVTSLPAFQDRLSISDAVTSGVLLVVCLAAAGGSVLADRLAVGVSSRRAVVVGLTVEAVALAVVALAPTLWVWLPAVVVYGVGLGAVDASANMQGVLAERGAGRPLMGRFFAAYTVGAIIGALVMSAGLALSGAVVVALLVTAVLQAAYLLVMAKDLDPARAAVAGQEQKDAPAVPRGPVIILGLVILAAFTVDSGVSTWSTVLLDDYGVRDAVAPLGYALYQAGVLVARLGTDSAERRLGARPLLGVAVAVGLLGGLVVAVTGGTAGAVAGFALSGLAVGVLVPVAFGLAGRVLPERSDEVVARVNIFNYAGALVGAVGIGLLVEPVGGAAFLVGAVLLVAAVPAVVKKVGVRQSQA
ncbi:MFS transporter [Corynebacterium variabile]|uniref:MFS transporter n=1 Tax=Corynebacterium variabile TaxID=1727 RepID=UPI001DEB3643|nr:MFS transporter [Corynebacterium variabile]HJG46787.1 MFS transporter [Corynebacterium variabile]